jgi:hypothetical protein
MNHPLRHAPLISRRLAAAPLLAFAVFLGWLCPSPAQAQRGGLPAEIKTAPDAKARTPEITAFIDMQVKALADDKKPDAQQRARTLLDQESRGGGATPSASYLSVYATVLNDKLLPLADSPSPRVRLNAAVALQKVAKNANNAALAPAAAKFAKDDSFAVALWATKASQPIMIPLALAGTKSDLPGAIVDAVRKHQKPKTGELTEEAYRALTLGGGFKNINENSVSVVTPSLLELLKYRNGLYATATPPRPELEGMAILHLTLARLSETKTGRKLRPQVVQEVSNLIGLLAQHAVARDTPEARKPFVDLLGRAGDGLVQISGRPELKGANLEVVGKALQDLRPGMADEEITNRAAAVFEAIKAKFPEVKPAPTIDPDKARQVEEEIQEEETAPAPGDAKPATRPAGAGIAADGDAGAAAGPASGDGAGAAGAGAADSEKPAPKQPKTPAKAAPAPAPAATPPAGKTAAPAPPAKR